MAGVEQLVGRLTNGFERVVFQMELCEPVIRESLSHGLRERGTYNFESLIRRVRRIGAVMEVDCC
jgi:hypothetical protein